MTGRIMTAEQKRKYDFFTVELARTLTLMRDEQTMVRYYIKDNGTEIVEVFDRFGNEIAKTDATSRTLLVVTHNILVMLTHGG